MSWWLRVDADWSKSEWLFVLSAESRLAWIELLCHIKIHGKNGKAKRLSPLVFSRSILVGEESVVQMELAAKQNGALLDDGGMWEIVNWEKYQNPDTIRKRLSRTVPDSPGHERTPCRVTSTSTSTSERRRPPLEDCKAHADDIGLPHSEAERFFDYYTSIGWVVGKAKTPMKVWKSAMANWKKGWIERGGGRKYRDLD